MKNLRQILFAMLVLTLIASCNKDEDASNDDLSIESTTINAKWIVTGSSDYESFEFNESGNYIVVKNTSTKSTNDPTIFFGTYEVVNETTLVLSDFGTLTLSSISENTNSITIQLVSNTDNEISVDASKQEEIESSTNTDLLCQTWEAVSLDGISLSNFYVLFSTAGTYFLYSEVDGEQSMDLGTWAWCNTDENKLTFTLDYVLDCDGIEIIYDLQLTSDSFVGIDMENGAAMELIMKPAISTKSASLVNPKTGVKIFGAEQ
jgi:hypothetical protein